MEKAAKRWTSAIIKPIFVVSTPFFASNLAGTIMGERYFVKLSEGGDCLIAVALLVNRLD